MPQRRGEDGGDHNMIAKLALIAAGSLLGFLLAAIVRIVLRILFDI